MSVLPGDAPPNGNRLKSIVALCALVVALFGGIPGYLAIKNYLDRSSVRIVFDEKESLPSLIANSLDKTMNGKFAILLSGVKIVSKGAEPFIAQDVTILIRSNGEWHEGKTFAPVQRENTAPNGATVSIVRLYRAESKRTELSPKLQPGIGPGDTLALVNWHDFSPGIKLGFGEPASFMVAAYFPSAPTDAWDFDRIRITLRDHLGNVNSEEYGTASFKRVPFPLFLDQSPP